MEPENVLRSEARAIERIRYDCPYCGLENSRMIHIMLDDKKFIETCDIEKGGCDKDFVVYWEQMIRIRGVVALDYGSDGNT